VTTRCVSGRQVCYWQALKVSPGQLTGANPAGNIGDACKRSIALALVSVFGMSAGLETAPSALAGGYATSALS
jgi:hypothetical protein